MSLKIRNLSKSFLTNDGDHLVLAGLNVTIRTGEITSILGPSGCGKTTLLRIIAGLESPSSGEVRFEHANKNPRGSNVFLIDQNPSLFPWMTVFENVLFGLRGAGSLSEDSYELAEQAINIAELDGLKALFPQQISGGMKQRVALARAFALDPRVLLMDEPLSALDSFNREILQEKMLAWFRERGMTVLLVTHSIEEAVFLSDRIVLFKPLPGRMEKELVGLPFTSELNVSLRRKHPDFFKLINDLRDFFRQ